jgi:cell division protein FtsZ
MGQATAEGEDRALKAAKQALESPLLNDNDIEGAKYILLNITYGTNEVMMDEISDITDFIQHAAGSTADVIWGHGMDETLGEKLSVTIIATGFKTTPDTGFEEYEPPVKRVLELDTPKESKPITQSMESPVENESTEEEPYIKEISTEASQPENAPAEEEVQRFNLFDEVEQEETSHKEVEENTQHTFELNEEKTSDSGSDDRDVQYFELTDDDSSEDDNENSLSTRVNAEVAAQLNKERLRNLREISDRIKSPQGLSELEKEPAYKRRNVRLENIPHSSESEVSKYTLSEDKERDGSSKSGLRPDNPYLHDNVD